MISGLKMNDCGICARAHAASAYAFYSLTCHAHMWARKKTRWLMRRRTTQSAPPSNEKQWPHISRTTRWKDLCACALRRCCCLLPACLCALAACYWSFAGKGFSGAAGPKLLAIIVAVILNRSFFSFSVRTHRGWSPMLRLSQDSSES